MTIGGTGELLNAHEFEAALTGHQQALTSRDKPDQARSSQIKPWRSDSLSTTDSYFLP